MDFNNTDHLILLFVLMVFMAVLFLSVGLTIPVFGESQRTRKKLQRRLNELLSESDQAPISSLLREKYLKKLSPLERSLERMPGMESLARTIEQSGHRILAYKLVLLSLLLGISLAGAIWIISKQPWLTLGFGVVAMMIPYLKVIKDRNKRMQRFDEQLPEAIDIIKRAVQAGHPFSESLNLVAEGLDGPVSQEFGITFADLNYGNDLRRAMLGLLERMPSVSLMAFVTSVLIQKETGGNLAEILDNIGKVIRGRFRFQRRVRTLSAEGRLSAWILMLVPFGLFLMIHFTTPKYLPVLVETESGRDLILYAAIAAGIGVLWIRKILRIEV
ncbi:type II secretion system F family protein [Marinobacterium arenosum]|uniref:type II secretion system F family protein n=1 Tax=Marinobacterium arenosum TaxID=2862496 RepID=UPI001C94D3C9|nr:type II secretion system F family protein [Marinobacterium arenosum]MBY4675741.1 type II secretion system F family protein [Marinobacterium arenosum]